MSHSKHIIRKSVIVGLSFAVGVVSTVFAAATYDANIQNRANTLFTTIKSNASKMDPSTVPSYYTLVRTNIASLIQVLTTLDSSIAGELGLLSLPGLDDGSLLGQITGTGNSGTGNTTATNTGEALCSTEYAPVCGLVAVQCITAPCDPVKQTFSNRCLAQKKDAKNISNGTCESGINDNTSNNNTRTTTVPNFEQKVFLSYKRSAPSEDPNKNPRWRSENECIIPAGGSECSFTITWTSTADTATVDVSESGKVSTLIKSAKTGSHIFSINPSATKTISYLAKPSNNYTGINHVASCIAGTEWNGQACGDDKTPPTIMINGDNPTIIDIGGGAGYAEMGARTTDVVDGDGIAQFSGNVNYQVVGDYTITYTAKDKAGNVATPVKRLVKVMLRNESIIANIKYMYINNTDANKLYPNGPTATDIAYWTDIINKNGLVKAREMFNEAIKKALSSVVIPSQVIMDTTTNDPKNDIKNQKYRTKNLAVDIHPSLNVINGLTVYSNNGAGLRGVAFNAPEILKVLKLYGIDKSQLAQLADVLDANGIKYMPFELYPGTGSDGGIDLRDLANGGMGTAHDWTVDVNCAAKGPTACKQVEENKALFVAEGIKKTSTTTGKLIDPTRFTQQKAADGIRSWIQFTGSMAAWYLTETEAVASQKQYGGWVMKAAFPPGYVFPVNNGGVNDTSIVIEYVGDRAFQKSQMNASESAGRAFAITNMYLTILGKSPDTEGLDYWTNSDLTLPQIEEHFKKVRVEGGLTTDVGNTAAVDIVLHTPNVMTIQKGTELTFGLSAVFKTPKDTDTCSVSYSTSSGKTKLVDFRLDGRVASSINRGRNPELWNEYIAAGGSRSVTILFEDAEGYYPNNKSTVVFTCNTVRKEAVVTLKSRQALIEDLYRTILGKDPDPTGLAYWVADKMTIAEIEAYFRNVKANEAASSTIATTLSSNKNEAKVGESVELQYSVSSDRTCDIYTLTNNTLLKKDISAGSTGNVSYVLSSKDINANSVIEIEMKCSNGTKKSKDIKVVNSCSNGYIYSTTYSACTKPVKVTLDCSNATTAAGWYKSYLGRCGEKEGMDYWNSQISLTSETEQYNAFKNGVDSAVGNKTKQEYLNGFLCDDGAIYIKNTTLCKK